MFRIQGELVREASFSGRMWEMTKKKHAEEESSSQVGLNKKKTTSLSSYWRVLRREFSGMIHKSSLVMSSSHSPQQPIHSLLGGSSQLGSGL